MDEAQRCYESLLSQGYTPESAKSYTRQHFPRFGTDVTAESHPPRILPVVGSDAQVRGGGAVAQRGDWSLQTADYGLFFTKIFAWMITVFTLGFAYPWAKCMVFNKWAENVRIDGRRIKFTGNGGEFLEVWVKIFLLSSITCGLYYFFVGYKEVPKYVDSKIEWN